MPQIPVETNDRMSLRIASEEKSLLMRAATIQHPNPHIELAKRKKALVCIMVCGKTAHHPLGATKAYEDITAQTDNHQ